VGEKPLRLIFALRNLCEKPLRLIFALRNLWGRKIASLNFRTPEAVGAKNRFA